MIGVTKFNPSTLRLALKKNLEGSKHPYMDPRGVQCIKHVRVYMSAHEGV